MKQRIVPRRRSGKLRRGQMQDRLDIAYDDCLYETSWSLRSLTTGTVVATSGFNRAEFGYLLSQFVGSVSGDEHQLVIHDSVVGCMCLGYADEFAALYATVADSHLLITSGNGAPVMSSTKSI
jgi:hypothetical protein